MKKIITLFLVLTVTLTLAACNGGTSNDKPVVITTLFPQYDMTRSIAGDLVSVEYLLPPGTTAHSYEPSPQTVIKIFNADLLIYTGDLMEPWVNSLIRSSANESLRILDLSKNITLIEEDDHGHDDHDDHDDDHGIEDSIHTFELLDRSNTNAILAYVHGNHWDGSLPTIEEGHTLSLGATIVSADERERELDSEGAINGIQVALYEGAQTGIVALENHGDHVDIRGLHEGSTTVVFYWTHDGDIRYITPPIQITVTEDDHDDDNHDDDDDGHNHDVDPHFWLDPLNAKQMVRDIRDQLILLMPEQAATFNENAQTYIAELDRMHHEFKDLRENSVLDVVMHGGHNAFAYFSSRYELEYISPYRGFSTDAEPTPQALGEMIDLMNQRNITHLFSERLIAPNVANAISEETGATILYLYAGENAPADDLKAGITFIDMLEHNLEQFKIGLRYHGNN